MTIKSDEECAARCEELMSEIVDLLAEWPHTRLDPRAWQQLLIYNKPSTKEKAS